METPKENVLKGQAVLTLCVQFNVCKGDYTCNSSHFYLYKQISHTVCQLALTGRQQHYSQSDSGLNLDKLFFSVYEVVPFFTTFDMQ